MGLSDPVAVAIDEAIALIDTLVSKTLEGETREIALEPH
jgi:hypothetical protein